ncbi:MULTISPECIES: SOS response-associated peptidase [Noviherbaspirillum]|jgi:putative SOS response-associated peptidase YedK|uniref:Abasic site processing protein n=1 Tax=Noviherbaspirillum galbum TaxID=2709383 RepID=A0A6B3SW52_9BURK|nr:SOS response-associated peptidase family protein [Noviherbaspirillum galbum]NEX63615.1 SOS response-associated peptidase [Noviherbaspirillum galbum]
MCANYLPATPDQLQRYFGVAAPDSRYKAEAYPGYMAPMIRPPRADSLPGDRACALAMFGMVPHWAKLDLARQTYNARTETVATKPSFRNAYKKRQFCIIPVHSFFEPNYETGKAVRWEISQAERDPLGLAGIWEYRADGPHGLPLLSFSMLTINADGDPLMQRFHKPDDEKRMVVILHPDQYDAWLHCPIEDAPDFFTRFPANQLTAIAAPRTSAKSAQANTPRPENGSLL